MTDPYLFLGSQLAAAAERQEARRDARLGVCAWLSHRLNAAAAAAVLVLAGGAVAVAATGVLNGAPVRPEVPPNANAGNGLPEGSRHLALLVADPDGGLPWGLRVFRTTRGQVCGQVGRLQAGQLGELGVDSAFGDDGRFHALAPDVLPPGYGGGSSTTECATRGQALIYEDPVADRSAMRLLPEAFAPHRQRPSLHDLRILSFGFLGPHAVSVTYRTPAGTRTVPVSGPDGAFLIVEPAVRPIQPFAGGGSGGSIVGEANGTSLDVIVAPGRTGAVVSAVTFRFGSHLCSQGSGAPVSTPCPTRRVIPPRRWFSPTRSLHAPVQLTLLPQSSAACSAAYLRYPCYKGQVEFTAPYAVTTAGSDYAIEAHSKCKTGGSPDASWTLGRNVRREEIVRADSLGLFVFTPACASSEVFQVRYLNPRGPSAHAPHESVIIGTVSMSNAKHPNGTPVRAQHASIPK